MIPEDILIDEANNKLNKIKEIEKLVCRKKKRFIEPLNIHAISKIFKQ